MVRHVRADLAANPEDEKTSELEQKILERFEAREAARRRRNAELWAELETLKRGAGAPQPDASADGAAIGGQAAAASGDGGADVDMGASASLVAIDVEDRDPAEEAASALVDASFDKVHFFDKLEDLQRDISGILGPTSKINILVDAVTSKPKVPLAMLENVASLIRDIPRPGCGS